MRGPSTQSSTTSTPAPPCSTGIRPGHDGLPGSEGAFLPCSFWLVQALADSGRVAEATSLFDDLIALASPVGLYAEEMDPLTHHHLGNYPQALTHAALVQAALALRDARRV